MEAAPLDTLALPAGQGRLVESFYWALADVRAEHALRLSAAYAKCMAAAGTPAESLGDARQRVERRFATAGPAGGAAWNEASAYEVSSAAADGRCRAANASLAAAVSAPAVRAFAVRHRRQLAAVAAGWAAMPEARDAARRRLNALSPMR
ncbi:hypothetical protein [Actinoplanes sp. NPDC048796]|uniref:hypothetical protein n=1 Tax=Actinoplanes sp. NPDC048796 TaxID=3155640 RepID=UPI0033CA0669